MSLRRAVSRLLSAFISKDLGHFLFGNLHDFWLSHPNRSSNVDAVFSCGDDALTLVGDLVQDVFALFFMEYIDICLVHTYMAWGPQFEVSI